MSLGHSAALKRAAGQNELKKKGRGRKEDGGGDAELERGAVLRLFFLFFKETLRDRYRKWSLDRGPNRPPDQNASPAFCCSDSLQLSSVELIVQSCTTVISAISGSRRGASGL